jgi:hypothetical protein
MLYQETLIWKRLDEKSAVRYSCLRNCGTGKFTVQSADYFRLPLSQESVQQFQRQFVELFCEIDPTERAQAFDSVEEAIAAHESGFAVGKPG